MIKTLNLKQKLGYISIVLAASCMQTKEKNKNKFKDIIRNEQSSKISIDDTALDIIAASSTRIKNKLANLKCDKLDINTKKNAVHELKGLCKNKLSV